MGEYEFRIIDLMNERDMSQAELARRSGITTSSLNRYLAGTDIPASKLKAIADALSVTVDAILGTGERLDSDELELLSLCRNMDEHGRCVLLATARALSNK